MQCRGEGFISFSKNVFLHNIWPVTWFLLEVTLNSKFIYTNKHITSAGFLDQNFSPVICFLTKDTGPTGFLVGNNELY